MSIKTSAMTTEALVAELEAFLDRGLWELTDVELNRAVAIEREIESRR